MRTEKQTQKLEKQLEEFKNHTEEFLEKNDKNQVEK